MAVSLMQKLRLAWRGWLRRQEEAERDFVKKNVGWGPTAPAPAPAPPPTPPARPTPRIDLEGLQVAYLDDSGRIEYYLDTDSGDVIEVHDGIRMDPPRFLRVPRRSEASDAEDRRAFLATLDPSPLRDRLAGADAAEFRRAIATDRAVERGWYNFKNDRATKAVKEWVEGETRGI